MQQVKVFMVMCHINLHFSYCLLTV